MVEKRFDYSDALEINMISCPVEASIGNALSYPGDRLLLVELALNLLQPLHDFTLKRW